MTKPPDPRTFNFLFPELQRDADNLLPEAGKTPQGLIAIGRSMVDADGTGGGDSDIPAAYIYFGQFVDHDITLETTPVPRSQLAPNGFAPLPLDRIRQVSHPLRTAPLELDSVYGLSAPRDGAKMRLGKVTPLNAHDKPALRPPGKGDENDLPREPRNADVKHDRAALIGDPRNDENTIISQLHLAFLLAHNKLVDQGNSFERAKRILWQHYQHIVLHDFLKKQIADRQIVEDTIERNRVYDPDEEECLLPLEFSVAAFRFGHSMVRAAYDFNLNFNTSGEPNTIPASLPRLYTIAALDGSMLASSYDTLPENWIIEWENFFEGGEFFNKAHRIDTKLGEPMQSLRDETEKPLFGEVDSRTIGASLAVRNLLRGYLLRMPTGQAVARALQEKLDRVRNIPVLTPEQIEEGAGSDDQVEKLQSSGFLESTPLWFYILAEASALADGQNLGPVGSTIVAEVLVGLVRRSEQSILRQRDWKPTLPCAEPRTFTLPDLLRFAGVLHAN
jgi:hypothetical protein